LCDAKFVGCGGGPGNRAMNYVLSRRSSGLASACAVSNLTSPKLKLDHAQLSIRHPIRRYSVVRGRRNHGSRSRSGSILPSGAAVGLPPVTVISRLTSNAWRLHPGRVPVAVSIRSLLTIIVATDKAVEVFALYATVRRESRPTVSLPLNRLHPGDRAVEGLDQERREIHTHLLHNRLSRSRVRIIPLVGKVSLKASLSRSGVLRSIGCFAAGAAGASAIRKEHGGSQQGAFASLLDQSPGIRTPARESPGDRLTRCPFAARSTGPACASRSPSL
jgi:hypothetical protein